MVNKRKSNLKNGNCSPLNGREIPLSERLSKKLSDALYSVQQNYSEAPEYKSIKVGLVSAIKGLENITLKITRGDDLSASPIEDFGD